MLWLGDALLGLVKITGKTDSIMYECKLSEVIGREFGINGQLCLSA